MSYRSRWLKRQLMVPFEWIGIALVMCVIPWLPPRGFFAFSDLIAALMYVFDRRGKRRALENLRILRGKRTGLKSIFLFEPDRAAYDATAAERKIIRRSYCSMVRAVVYVLWTCVRAKRRCTQVGFLTEAGRKLMRENRPVVTVSGHIGLWENLPHLGFLEGHLMMSVSKEVGTGLMTRWLLQMRRSIGQEIVPATGAFKPLMAGVRNGRSLGLLVDQKVTPKHGGIWIRFLGVPMPAAPGPAFFAAKGKIPIVVAWSRPLKGGRYRCEIVDVIPAAEARDIWGTTQRIAADLERIVRRHPSCWVLNYNYFSTIPMPDDLAALAEREAKSV